MKVAIFFAGVCLFSADVFAITGGTPVDWKTHDNIVRLDSVYYDADGRCTGTIIAGKYILTAAHCLKEINKLDRVTNSYSSEINVKQSQFYSHPEFVPDEDNSFNDVGFVILDKQVEHTNIQHFANLSRSSFTENASIRITGFGGTAYKPNPLNYSDFTFSHAAPSRPAFVYADQVNMNSHTTGGDSGGAWTSSNDLIIGIHKGSATTTTGSGSDEVITRETYGSDLHYARQFILDTVNAWHYPTVAQVSGSKTIEIQSLNLNDVDLLDTFYSVGDVNVDETSGSCVMDRTISPFEICTLEVSSNGGEGTIILADGQEIQINKTIETVGGDINSGSNTGGSSGGSMSIFSMFALLGLGFARNRKKNTVSA